MEPKTALLIALGLAVGLPYVTIALLRAGRIGMVIFTGIFLGAFLLVILSDYRNSDGTDATDATDAIGDGE